ncbi:ArsR/SmtB family transcription factor [Pelagibacterium montanilacus]|uniref:ArsR/SmtB family transcription factor n=1 Tax=Pelagibacterium montanilacus TaxID=2185280 RepID=UPI001FE8AB64|nr:metalloregulator ArsR/SmtB family transcription factor [Pelagibacterium montanilacus]
MACFKAAGETTRLRLLALLHEGELSVKDFTEILGQSQPRVSRHLKLLADAGLITRHAEGAWAYYRLADGGVARALLDWIGGAMDPDAADLAADRAKLARVRAQRKAQADAWFADIAPSWDRLRSLHAPDAAVEAAILASMPSGPVPMLLDLGTGTGRMLELLAGRYEQAVGVDASREMLALARSKLESAGLAHARIRHGDIEALEEYRGQADRVVIHQVLHYFDDPGIALASAARCLRPGGAMLIIDFAPHALEFLRTEQAHRRLGLSSAQMEVWAADAGLTLTRVQTIAPERADGLTVCLWQLEPETGMETTA